MIGMRTTLTIERNIAISETSTHCPASIQVRNGVTIGASIVVVIVMETERATSPFERYVITFDEVPPGHVPTSITPTASSGGRLNAFASSHARPGMIVNCAIAPMITSLGRWNTSLKSSALSVMPIPNITMPSRFVICGAAHLNDGGKNNAMAAIMMTMSDMNFETILLSFSRKSIMPFSFTSIVF